MTNIVLISSYLIKEPINEIFDTFVKFIDFYMDLKDSFGYRRFEFIRRDFRRKNSIISNKLWLREKVIGRNHILISLNPFLEDPFYRIACFSVSRMMHSIIFIFSADYNLDLQLETISFYLQNPLKDIRIILEDLQNQEEYLDFKNKIQLFFDKFDCKIEPDHFYDISPKNYVDSRKSLLEKYYNSYERGKAFKKYYFLQSAQLWEELKKLMNEKPIDDKVLKFLRFDLVGYSLFLILEERLRTGFHDYVEAEDGESSIYHIESGDIVEITGKEEIRIHQEKDDMWFLLDTISLLSEKRPLIYWMEMLPFPLASILLHYIFEPNEKKKLLYLLDFFECFTVFQITILLSIIYNEETGLFYNNEWITKDYDDIKWLYHPGMGQWLTLSRRICKIYRNILSSKNKREEFLERSKLPHDFIEILVSKKLLDLLEPPKKIRNLTKHSPQQSISEEFISNNLKKLKMVLEDLRELIGSIFSKVQLIIPLSSEKKGRIILNKVKFLQGSYTVFRSNKIQLFEMLDVEQLYLYNPSYSMKLAVKLIPFIRFKEGIIYFFNRFDEDKIRWVSFHSKYIPQLTEKDELNKKLMNFIKILQNLKNFF